MNLKKSISTFAFALLACASVGTLASCNNDPGKIVFWHTMGSTNKELLNAMIDEFHKSDLGKDSEGNPIVIEHDSQGGYPDIKAKILKAIPAKKTPTMAFAYPDHVAEYINAGAALKLNDFIYNEDETIALSTSDLEDYSLYWEEGSSYDTEGSVYSVPYLKSTEVIFFNKTVFEEEYAAFDGYPAKKKYQIPTKWYNDEDPDDLTTMVGLCRQMKRDYRGWYKKHNSDATADQIEEAYNNFIPLGYDSDDNMYITLSAQLGIPYTSLNPDRSGNFDFGGSDSHGLPEAREMVKRIYNWYKEGLVITKGSMPNSVYTSTKFTDEKLWMSIGSTGGTKFNMSKAFEVDVAPIPQQNPDNPKVISQGPSIVFFKNSKITEEAQINSWKFYKFITQTDFTAQFAIETGYEPVRLSAYESEQYVDHINLDLEGKTLFNKVAHLTSTPAVTGAYFTSPAFIGSATAREQVGGIITQTLLEKNYSDSHTLDQELDENFYNAMMECIFAS